MNSVSVEEYLNTSYRPDCDYLEGELLERNVGEWDHSRLQGLAGPPPAGPIVIQPPFLCVEILSPSDRFSEMRERVGDYLSFGVRYGWAIDPRTRQAFVYTATGVREVKDGVLPTDDPAILVILSELE